MQNTPLTRKLLAVATIVPLAVIGLAGCQSDSAPAERPKSTKTTKKDDSGGVSTDGGGLPFGGETEPIMPTESTPPSPTTAPSPSTAAPTPPSNGGGGGTDVVKWDGHDLSTTAWDVTCSPGSGSTKTYINAYESGKSPGSQDAVAISLSSELDGRLTFLYVDQASDDDSLWYSENTTSDPSAGGTLTLEGGVVTVTGTGYAYNDYKEKTPLPFEIKLTCDTNY